MTESQGMTPGGSEDAFSALTEQIVLVGPILNELYKHSAEGRDYWLKKKSLQLLADWILTVQDIATLLSSQNESLIATVAALEKELEQHRKVKKVWTPLG